MSEGSRKKAEDGAWTRHLSVCKKGVHSFEKKMMFLEGRRDALAEAESKIIEYIHRHQRCINRIHCIESDTNCIGILFDDVKSLRGGSK